MSTLRAAAQAVLDRWDSPRWEWHQGPTAALMADLRAALAEPVQEPVAWRWGYRSVTTGEMDWRGYVEIAADPNLRSPAIIMEPLYAAPPQRKPLTDDEIEKLLIEHAGMTVVFSEVDLRFARAVERAHGIGGSDA